MGGYYTALSSSCLGGLGFLRKPREPVEAKVHVSHRFHAAGLRDVGSRMRAAGDDQKVLSALNLNRKALFSEI